jgi:hypothetical protein
VWWWWCVCRPRRIAKTRRQSGLHICRFLQYQIHLAVWHILPNGTYISTPTKATTDKHNIINFQMHTPYLTIIPAIV